MLGRLGRNVLISDSAGLNFLFGRVVGLGEGTIVVEGHEGRKDLLLGHFLLFDVFVCVQIAQTYLLMQWSLLVSCSLSWVCGLKTLFWLDYFYALVVTGDGSGLVGVGCDLGGVFEGIKHVFLGCGLAGLFFFLQE